MATTLQTILNMTRDALNESVPRFWSDAELLRYMNRGIRDAWRQISVTNQNYQFQLDVAATLTASATTITGVPSNLAVLFQIEPLDMVAHPITFIGKEYTSADFQNARREADDVDPSQPNIVYYCLTGAGAPVAAPTIHVAPSVSATVTLALAFRPTIGAELIATGVVPLPGEVDQALIHWTTAYALGRERGTAQPDAEHLRLYQRELDVILVAITPRDEQEDQIVGAMFEPYW